MFWMMNDWNRGWNRGMGPRGPRVGHRGYGYGGFGLGGLFLLPALFFGGWMVIAVFGSLLGMAVMLLGSVFSGLAAVVEGIFSAAFSGSGLVLGIVIGLALFIWLKKRNASQG